MCTWFHFRQTIKTRIFKEPTAVVKPKFTEEGLFNISKFQCRGTKKGNVYKEFVEKWVNYHKQCYAHTESFSTITPPPKEKYSESEEFSPTSSKWPKRVSLPLGQIVHFICNKSDTSLCIAGVLHASKTAVDKQNVKEKTEKIKTMSIALDSKPILAKLFSGVIVSNELNYHKTYFKDFLNKYNQKVLAGSNREVSLQNEVNEFWKAVCFKKMRTLIRETYVRSINFEASALLKLCERLLKESNVTSSPLLTRFTGDILSPVPGLEKRGVTKKKVKAIFDNLVKEVMNPNSFLKQLNKIVIPIRKAISPQQNDFTSKFSTDCHEKFCTKGTASPDKYAH